MAEIGLPGDSDGTNIIVGQTHFIKTVEDIYEAIVNTVLR
jgi:adenosine/AMP kinase